MLKLKFENRSFCYYNQTGQIHNEDGPAIIRFKRTDEGNKIDREDWFVNGNRHRIGGPVIEFTTENKFYFIGGFEYSEKKYNKEMNKLKKEVLNIF